MKHMAQLCVDWVFMNPEQSLAMVLAFGAWIYQKLLSDAQKEKARHMIEAVKGVLNDVDKAKEEIHKVTGATRLTTTEVKAIVEEVKGPDTNKKKVSRAARKLFRGWIGF